MIDSWIRRPDGQTLYYELESFARDFQVIVSGVATYTGLM